MWIVEIVYIVHTLLISWAIAGYFVFIAIMGILKKRPAIQFSDKLPFLSVFVPLSDDDSLNSDKIAELKAIDYPTEYIEFLLLPAKNNSESIRAAITTDLRFKFLKSKEHTPSHIMNLVLRESKGSMIAKTVPGTKLTPSALREIAMELEQNNEAVLAGACISAFGSDEISIVMHEFRNKVQLLENDAHSASNVSSSFFVFKKNFIARFQDDLIFDSLFLSQYAISQGKSIIFTHKFDVSKLPVKVSFVKHFKRSFTSLNCHLRETLKTLYKLPELSWMSKLIIITRVLQNVILPFSIVLWCVISISMLTTRRWDLLLFSSAFIILMLIIRSYLFSWVTHGSTAGKYSLLSIIKAFMIYFGASLITTISYIFYYPLSKNEKV